MKQLITVLVMMLVAIGAALAVSLVDGGRHEAAAGGYNDLLLNCKIHRVATIDPIQRRRITSMPSLGIAL